MLKNKRINKEIQNMMKDNDLGRNSYSIEIINDSSNHLLGKIRGAADTPFEYGIFIIDIIIPNKYPFEPPVCKFETKVWHPNISSQTGAICLDILKDQWAAAMTIESVLTSLQSFLSSPEPSNPQDAVVAHQFLTDRQMYERTAKYWTYIYALDDQNREKIDKREFKDFEEKIAKLVKKMSREQALSALSNSNWDLDRVLKSN